MMKSMFSLFILAFIFVNGLFCQPFDFERLDNPVGTYFNQYLGELDELVYLTFVNSNFDSELHRFNGDDLELIPAPSNLTFNYSDEFTGDIFYLVYNDVNFDNTVVSFDGMNLTPLFDIDPAGFYSGYSFEFNGLPYFKIFDGAFIGGLWVFDGVGVQEIPLPANTEYGNFLGEINGVNYVTLIDNIGNETIYAFDGVNFTLLPLPIVSAFLNTAFQNSSGIYLSVFDANFVNSLYLLDGTNVTEIPVPSGYVEFGGYVGNINGRDFIALDDANFDGTLFEIEANSNFIEFPNPTGFSYVFNPGPTESEDNLYPTYANANFIYFMGILDGSSINIVTNPPGGEYNDYYLRFKEGHMTGYWDSNFDVRLTFYNNTSFTTIANPSGFIFGSYSFQLGTKVYFRFRDANFDNTLFALALNIKPLSEDNSVNTERETPYAFSSTDFAFSDEDLDDNFEGIQVVDLPAKGILHLFGAQVSPGQEIPIAELEKLNYVPLDDGVGQPYDSFTFKVSDGADLSDETYTLFINVNTPVSTEEIELSAGLEIFPNPATDFVTISLKEYDAYGALQLLLLNPNGQIIDAREIDENQEILQLKNLSNGIYNLHIRNEKINLSRIVMVAK